jgi:hypothetical protein
MIRSNSGANCSIRVEDCIDERRRDIAIPPSGTAPAAYGDGAQRGKLEAGEAD